LERGVQNQPQRTQRTQRSKNTKGFFEIPAFFCGNSRVLQLALEIGEGPAKLTAKNAKNAEKQEYKGVL
jgi:hypothetical protein